MNGVFQPDVVNRAVARRRGGFQNHRPIAQCAFGKLLESDDKFIEGRMLAEHVQMFRASPLTFRQRRINPPSKRLW